MARYPLSVLQGSAQSSLAEILALHFPLKSHILDPTYGDGLMWSDGLLWQYEVASSDIKPPYSQDLFKLTDDHPDLIGRFDGILYDPPYMVGVAKSDDERQDAYGGYAGTEQDLKRYMGALTDPLPKLLKHNGKLILKCADQYVVSERKFYPRHIAWCNALIAGGFNIIDFYVYRYHHISPTAFQVKERPAAVVVHSYFIVGQLMM